MDFFDIIAKSISEKTNGISAEEIKAMLETPPSPEMGDCALPCFKLAKSMRMAPPKIAESLADGLAIDGIKEIKTLGGYLNFYFDTVAFAEKTVKEILADENYGGSEKGSTNGCFKWKVCSYNRRQFRNWLRLCAAFCRRRRKYTGLRKAHGRS